MAEPVATIEVVDELQGPLSAIDAVLGWLASLVAQITQWFLNLATQLTSWMAGIVAAIEEWMVIVTTAIWDFVTAMMDSIVYAIETMVQTVIDQLTKAWEWFYDLTVEVIDSITTYVSDTWDAMVAWWESLIDTVEGWIVSAKEGISQLIETAVVVAEELGKAAIEKIGDFLGIQVDQIEIVNGSIIDTAAAGIETMIGGAESLVATIGARISSMAEALSAAATDVVATIAGIKDDVLLPIKEKIDALVSDVVSSDGGESADKFIREIQDATKGEMAASEMRRLSSIFWQFAIPDSALGRMLLVLVIGVVSLIPIGLGATSILARAPLQELEKVFPTQVLAAGDAAAAWRRGLIGKEVAIDIIQRQGMSEHNAGVILDLTSAVPAEQDIFAMEHRGILDPEATDKALHQRGYSPEWIRHLRSVAQIHPPVQDLITMAVREVFTPAIAQAQGQFEDFPLEFAEEARKGGLSDEWARNYWAAHWSLPSARQGFQMLHRGIIGEEKLKQLLRALDVMPGWRDPLLGISYKPYTRVDIRRMHRVGVLTEAQVNVAYHDIGYDDAKAATLTAFTLALNADKEADDIGALGELSRSSILDFYADGLITRERAHALLVELGYSGEGASLFLASVEHDAERKERKEIIDSILDQAKSGAISQERAQDLLGAAGLETEEIRRALGRLQIILERKNKIPTRTEGAAFLAAGIINMSEYHDLLERLGYGPKWANAFADLALQKGQESEA